MKKHKGWTAYIKEDSRPCFGCMRYVSDRYWQHCVDCQGTYAKLEWKEW